LGRQSKSKLEVYTEVPLQLVPEIVAAPKRSKSGSVSLERRKEEAEKPLYLRRV
jgi:hypothetical protein